MKAFEHFLVKNFVLRFTLGALIIAWFSIPAFCKKIKHYTLKYHYSFSETIDMTGGVIISGFTYQHQYTDYYFDVIYDDSGNRAVTYDMRDDRVESSEVRVIQDLPWYNNYFHSEFAQWITEGPIGKEIGFNFIIASTGEHAQVYIDFPNGLNQIYSSSYTYKAWNEFGEVLNDDHETYSTEYAYYPPYNTIYTPLLYPDSSDGSQFSDDNWTLTVEIIDVCTIDQNRFKDWDQYEAAWINKIYDFCTNCLKPSGNICNTIGCWGCGLTSLAMALHFAGQNKIGENDLDPLKLNEWMKENDGFSGHTVNWAKTTNKISNGELIFNYNAKKVADSKINATQANNMLQDIICNKGLPAIVGVSFSGGAPRHWVVAIGKDGNRWLISDPGNAKCKPSGCKYLDEYGSRFWVRGYVERKASSQPTSSQLKSSTNEYLGGAGELLIGANCQEDIRIRAEDPSKNITGYIKGTDEIIEDIPRSAFFLDGLSDNFTEEVLLNTTSWICISEPSSGIYHVELEGTKLDSYMLYLNYLSQDGSSYFEITIPDVADQGLTSSFDIQIGSTPGSPVFAIRIATFDKTLKDIETCYKLHEIDDMDITNSLSSKINDASDAQNRGDKETAMQILNDFITEVEAQRLKHITETAAHILIEDADYLISQLQSIITQQPEILLSRSNLNFGAISSLATSNQTVIITNSGTGTLDWAATPSAAWITASPGSGSGGGSVTIGVDYTSLVAGIYSGSVAFTDPGATNSPQTVTVNLQVYASGGTTIPFGDFATPIDGTTGITGAIPVTGWVLDDIETTKVEIWRDPVLTAGEVNSLYYIGDGSFVEGARPDVEVDYPTYPLNYKAGWGYMLLTNFLPNQGNGTYKLYAISTDSEGNTVTLGTKTITCSNATATKPFGTIDTPTQGGDAYGNPFLNFGWVLSPLPKTVPKDGSLISVYVDSVLKGSLNNSPNVYNQYRADVAGNFPGLNNSSGPVGAYFLDTTAFTNGVHTIYWIAYDDAGVGDGIGSRYFNIVNTGSPIQGSNQDYNLESQNPFTLASIKHLPVSFEPIKIKRGFSLHKVPEIVLLDNSGQSQIEIREVELLELDFGEAPKLVGFLLMGDELRPLPIGSTLDVEKGVFYWMPGPGFVGTYDLVFLKKDESKVTKRISVKVKINPKY